MTAKECITGRRSIRQYTDQPVSHELLAQIVETASYAPSWKHTQIVRYIAVEGEKKAKLAACTSSFPGNGKIMENAPMVVAVTVIKGFRERRLLHYRQRRCMADVRCRCCQRSLLPGCLRAGPWHRDHGYFRSAGSC